MLTRWNGEALVVDHGGGSAPEIVEVWFPPSGNAVANSVEATRQAAIMRCDDRLFEKHESMLEQAATRRGAVLVARVRADDTYAVHVWHELHEGVLERLVG